MSLNAAALRVLADKGLSAADIVELAEAMENRADKTAAIRQQRRRDKVKAERDASHRDVTRDEPPYEVSSTPPLLSETKVSPRSAVAAKARWHRLPENWEPTRPLPPRLQAKVDEWPPGRLADELAAFHRWAANAEDKNGKGRKLDWDAAWHNWIDRKHSENGHSRQPPAQQGNGRRPSPALELYKRGALREAEEARLGEDGAPDWGAGASLPPFGPS